MADTVSLSWLVRQKVGFYYILAVIALVTIFVFIIDIIAPIGMLIWILYLIPLFLTVFLHLKYAPVAMMAVIIFLKAVSLSLSPGDMSAEYVLINLTFFVMILGIVTVFTEEYISNVENLTKSKELDKDLRRINRHLGMLLAIIRHRILNRLGIIDGYTKYLRYNPEHHHLDGILEKIESTTSEIQNIIEFAKSNMNLIYLKPQWIDLDTRNTAIADSVIDNLGIKSTGHLRICDPNI